LIRSIENRGIIGGLRVCLEAATGRYVIPLDSDDLLFPDALQVCAQGVRDNDWPSFLFTDEDHFERGIARDPFRRPGWDPVLNLSGSYIWHLCVFDRNAALELGVYSDTGANWCQDWDTVLRFVRAGHQPVHLPEIVYHWRAHPGSQTNCRQPNPGSLQSQRHVLQQHIDTLPHPERFEIRPCPIDRGSQEWQIVRQPIDMPTVDVIASAESTEDILRSLRSTTAHYIAVVTDGVTPQDEAWIQEAVGLFELHAELSLLTGRIIDETGLVIGGADDEMGADVTDAGPFSLWLKTRCVDRVDPRFFVMRAEVLRQIADKIGGGESLDELAGELSEQVIKQGNRIAISPLLVAVRCSAKALSAGGT